MVGVTYSAPGILVLHSLLLPNCLFFSFCVASFCQMPFSYICGIDCPCVGSPLLHGLCCHICNTPQSRLCSICCSWHSLGYFHNSLLRLIDLLRVFSAASMLYATIALVKVNLTIFLTGLIMWPTQQLIPQCLFQIFFKIPHSCKAS